MERQAVTSSNIRAVGYDARSETLEVEFQGGAVYRYEDVPASVHRAFVGASSVGSFFHRRIKGRYRTGR